MFAQLRISEFCGSFQVVHEVKEAMYRLEPG